jgi:hypothetical protein
MFLASYHFPAEKNNSKELQKITFSDFIFFQVDDGRRGNAEF